MNISVITMFPEMFGSFCDNPVIGRAVRDGFVSFNTIDIKEYTPGCYRKIDDSPLGGGNGTLIRVDALSNALSAVSSDNPHVVLLSPKGEVFNQNKAHELLKHDNLVFVCGHYEGIDARFEDYVDEQISLGDFILTGGENAAGVICESVIRLIPGVLRDGSADNESFENGLLEYKQYTHPVSFEGKEVPSVLLSGNAAEINRFNKISSIMETAKHRPDLLYKAGKMDFVGKSEASVLMFNNMVMKISPVSSHSQSEPCPEYERMSWLSSRLPVPELLGHHVDDKNEFLLMSKLKGRMLCDSYYLSNPIRLMKTAAAALKTLWEVDVSSCPFDSSADAKLEIARYNIDNGLSDFSEPGDFDSPDSLYSWLVSHKPVCKTPVLSHGDFCLPNIFASSKGITGVIDLGLAGVGDMNCDIAICMRSIRDNANGRYNGGTPYFNFEPSQFFDILGISPDRDAITWYTLLDELF